MFLTGKYRFSARRVRRVTVVCSAVIFLCSAMTVTPASANMLLDEEVFLANYVAQPTSPGVYEMIWNNGELYEGPGAIGTNFGAGGPGDGESPLSQQTVPGLLIESPFEIPGIPGSEVNASGAPDYVTTFYDATLDIIPISGVGVYGIPSAGNAVVTTLPGGITVITQPLGSALFEIWSTDPVEMGGDVENPILLLAGTINSAAIVSILGSTTGTALSANVTYTSGAIMNAAVAAGVIPGSIPVYGEFSWSLLNAKPAFSVNPSTHLLNPFQANATGQFTAASAAPEPGVLALLCTGGLALVGYVLRRRRK